MQSIKEPFCKDSRQALPPEWLPYGAISCVPKG